MASGPNKMDNISHAIDLVRRAATGEGHRRPQLISLPEYFTSPHDAEPANGYTSQRLAEVARELGIYLVGGSFKVRDTDDRMYNTCTVWSPSGEVIAKYRKVYSFELFNY